MSDKTLDELIAKVKSEAIDSAEKEAQRIINEAKLKAKQLLETAESEKQQLLKSAENEAADIVTKGEIALKQAARDVQISTKNDLLNLLKTVLESDVKSAFTSNVYASVILKVIDNLGDNIAINLPPETEEQIMASIKQKISTNKVELKESDQLFSGLSITKTDEGWSYDITAKEIAELLSQHLNHKWIAFLNQE